MRSSISFCYSECLHSWVQCNNILPTTKLLCSCLAFISSLRSIQADDLNTPLDLHSKDGQFCVDISDFLDLEWVEKEVEECKTVFEKSCEEKTQNVCLTVNETLCEVGAYSGEKVQMHIRTLTPDEYILVWKFWWSQRDDAIKLGIGSVPVNEIDSPVNWPPRHWIGSNRDISMLKLMAMASIWLQIRT